MVGGKLIKSYLYIYEKGGRGIDSQGVHSTCIFAYHGLSLRNMSIFVQTVQKGDITLRGGGGTTLSERRRCITKNIFKILK